MDIQTALKQNLVKIIELARLAPSVHNTQPWTVSLNDDTITIHKDTQYILRDGDPTGRQSIISLGIFSEAIVIVSNSLGFNIDDVSLHDEQVTIHFNGYDPKDDNGGSEQIRSLRTRCTDRSIYKPTVVSQEDISRIEHSNDRLNARVYIVNDQATLTEIAKLTGKAIGVALGSPGFRTELRHFLVLPWSQKRRGIAVKSLYIPKLIAYLEPLLLRLGVSTGAEAKLERERWLSASAVVLILANGDLAKYWLEVGRSYLRVSLAIEGLGLSQATSAAIVEASDYHEDIETRLGTSQRILAVIRIGQGSKKRYYSPRATAAELITSS